MTTIKVKAHDTLSYLRIIEDEHGQRIASISKWANGTVTSMFSEHLTAEQHRLIADAMDELEKEDG